MYNRIKNLVSANLLSLTGYVYGVYYFWGYFIQQYVEINNAELQAAYSLNSTEPGVYAPILHILFGWSILAPFIFLFFVICCLIENLLKDKHVLPDYKTPQNRLYKYLFVTGLFLYLIPVLDFLSIFW